jgi:cytoplasmic iron level regulating protein YaaA (DUF328/UPF0246 family)
VTVFSGLNVARYQAWSPKFTARNARQAVLAFNGDVYDGLAARTLARRCTGLVATACVHLERTVWRAAPAGLHAALPAGDGQTRLPIERGKHLYDFWGRQISPYLNKRLPV